MSVSGSAMALPEMQVDTMALQKAPPSENALGSDVAAPEDEDLQDTAA